MAVITGSDTRTTLADISQAMGPNNELSIPVDLLSQRGFKGLMAHLPFKEGNLTTGHEFSVETALPTAYLRKYNTGIPASKGASAKQVEGMSQIEAQAIIDVRLASKFGSKAAAYRAMKNKRFVEALEQKFMGLFYSGDSRVDQDEFNGIRTRLSTLASGHTINCGGTGSNNTSLFVMQLGDEFGGIYPKGSGAASAGGNGSFGWNHTPIENIPYTFQDGTQMLSHQDFWNWEVGIALENWQRLVRVCNINVTDLRGRINTQALTASTNILYALSDALHMLPDNDGTTVIGANRTFIAAMAKMGMDKSQNVLDVQRGLHQFRDGQEVSWETVSFLGKQFVAIDKIVNTEARVV